MIKPRWTLAGTVDTDHGPTYVYTWEVRGTVITREKAGGRIRFRIGPTVYPRLLDAVAAIP